MGNIFGKTKNEDDAKKKFSFTSPFQSNSPKKQKTEKPSDSKQYKLNAKQIIMKKQIDDFFEVDLNNAEPNLDIIESQIENPPVRPPRKFKNKNNTLERVDKKIVNTLDAMDDKSISSEDYKNRIPVEEPIIVPRKEPVHICDGTHHHVINIVDGKIVQSHCMKAKNTAVKRPNRRNLKSSASFSNIEELKTVRPPRIKKGKKQMSTISLPTESKVSLSETTAARLENYLKRCKNFNELAPMQLLEQLESNGCASDSDESLTDDWGILDTIHRHGIPSKSPFEPRCKLDSTIMMKTSHKFDNNEVIPHLNDIEERRESIDTNPEDLKNPSPKPNNKVPKYKEERRESIDDFFDAEPLQNHLTTGDELKINTLLGRRGSDSFFSESDPSQLSKVKYDIYFTNTMLYSESKHSARQMCDKNKTNETTVPIESNTLQTENIQDSEECQSTSDEALHQQPKRKSGNVQHSNLLKILQDNSTVSNENEPPSENM